MMAKYMWKMKNPNKGIAIIPTATEHITITTVEFTSVPTFDIANTTTFTKNIPIVNITEAKNNMKNL